GSRGSSRPRPRRSTTATTQRSGPRRQRGAGPPAGPSPAPALGGRQRLSLAHPVPVLPALPGPVSPVRWQDARCQVPAPVLPELMTSVPFVPTRTFTGGPETPGAGVQVTGPLTGAGPDAI